MTAGCFDADSMITQAHALQPLQPRGPVVTGALERLARRRGCRAYIAHAGIVRVLHNGLRAALHDPPHAAVLDRYDMPVPRLGREDCAAFALRQHEQDLGVVRRLRLSRSDPLYWL